MFETDLAECGEFVLHEVVAYMGAEVILRLASFLVPEQIKCDRSHGYKLLVSVVMLRDSQDFVTLHSARGMPCRAA